MTNVQSRPTSIRSRVLRRASGLAPLAVLAGLVTAHAAVETDTSTHKESGFEDGNISPFWVCTTQSPNYAQATTLNGVKCMKFYWTQSGYDGTRMDRGAEACSALQTFKEGWFGFNFYLPSNGFPRDKEQAIAQIFQAGSCNSWAAMLVVRNNTLVLQHRSYCGTPTEAVIATDIQRDAWKPVIIHFVASRANAGTMEVWYAGAVGNQGSPTYRRTGINFGFGTWNANDTLATGNQLTFKFGEYCHDDSDYTTGESRTLYFDNVSQLAGNSSTGWGIVNPTR